jgi:hypothetical protein
VLAELQVLPLSQTKVTDVGLAHLSQLGEMIDLSLRDTKITGAGRAYL